MENKPSIVENKLPTLADLYNVANIEETFKTDQLNLILNQEPQKSWVKENPFAGNSKYIPIGILETLLQRIFKEFRVEILREGTMFNAVYATIRLHYVHPVTGEWSYHDGVGAAQIQTKKGASAADLASINNNAVMMALPMAKSFAIKDACDHFGKLFGRDLNRKETLGFTTDKNLNIEEKLEKIVELFEWKKDTVPSKDFANIERIIENKEHLSYDKILKLLGDL